MPRFAIVNEIDRPYPRLVAEKVNGKYYYMNRATDKYLKSYEMQPDNPTNIKDFGFEITDNGDTVIFTKVRPSIATYYDGRIREWNGDGAEENNFILPKVIL